MKVCVKRVLLALSALAVLACTCVSCAADQPLAGVSPAQLVGDWSVEGRAGPVIALGEDGKVVIDGLSAGCGADSDAPRATGRWDAGDDGVKFYIFTDQPCFDAMTTGEFFSEPGDVAIRFYEPGADRDGFPEPVLVLIKAERLQTHTLTQHPLA